MAKLIALQMTSSPDVSENLATVNRLLSELTIDEPTLVVLPECFACFGGSDKDILEVMEEPGKGLIQESLALMSKTYGVWIAGGSMPIAAYADEKYYASCLLFNDSGECLAEYRKVHLFDVNVSDNTGRYLESKHTEAGSKCVVVEDTPFGRLGLAICYDVRFPGLFQAMGEVDVIALPAAFTQKTGEAHWHTLIKARAIEKQCYVVAADQSGEHANKRQTYGHSCIVSPWGEVEQELAHGAGTIIGSIDKELIARTRQSMPVYEHNKFRSELV